MRRIAVLLLGISACFGVLLFNESRQPTPVRLAQGMLGEHWYRIELTGQHVGYMYNQTALSLIHI